MLPLNVGRSHHHPAGTSRAPRRSAWSPDVVAWACSCSHRKNPTIQAYTSPGISKSNHRCCLALTPFVEASHRTIESARKQIVEDNPKNDDNRSAKAPRFVYQFVMLEHAIDESPTRSSLRSLGTDDLPCAHVLWMPCSQQKHRRRTNRKRARKLIEEGTTRREPINHPRRKR